LAHETVRVLVVDDEVCELKLQRGARRVYCTSSRPPARVRDSRFKRRLRDSLRGTGVSYEGCWRNQRIKGNRQVTFCVFSLSDRLLKRQNDEKILDLLEGKVKTVFLRPVRLQAQAAA
jgi:hypothetical protein